MNDTGDTPRQSRLHPSTVIARGRAIRDLNRLLNTYGGQARHWRKRKGPKFVESGQIFEYHWYEHHGLGRFEFKRKHVRRS